MSRRARQRAANASSNSASIAAPGAPIGGLVISERRIAERAGVRVGEAVDRATVAVELPVDLRRPHLRLERVDLLGRDQGSLAPWHTSTLARMFRASSGRGASSPAWKVTTALSGAPLRPSSSAVLPPKQ